MSDRFEQAYNARVELFGDRPDSALRELVRQRDINGVALDVGAGHGRNSVFLARAGLRVHAVDTSEAATIRLRKRVRQHKLHIHVFQADIRQLPLQANRYDLIVADTILCQLEFQAVSIAAARLMRSLKPDGWLYATVFDETDPHDSEFAQSLQTYFTRSSLRALFSNLRTETCQQLHVDDNRHGMPHEHVLINLIAQKGRYHE